jgi:single-stranded-DNA-specific exonuclease
MLFGRDMRWIDPTPITVPDDLWAAIGGHPLVVETLARRGITSSGQAQAFLDPAQYHPADAFDLPDMERAAEIVQAAVRDKKTILIWGDFDVDGQTSTALLVNALRGMGAAPRFYIPDRLTDGHGIRLERLKTLLTGVDLLLTCDTGIAAHESVAWAKGQGVQVVVTDHHSLLPTLPPADAVVNPMRLPLDHPLRELSGVGTAYKLIEGMGDANAAHQLDLTALGLVADVMVQAQDTRYLIQRGLEVMRQGKRPGLRALFDRAEINPAEVNSTALAFDLAPRLNALGRLADANPAVELLTTHDPALIAMLVNRLEGMNNERRLLTRQIVSGATDAVERDPALLDYAALVVAHADWHAGIVGVVASRLVERYRRPVVLLSLSGPTARGSARSVPGCNLVEAFEACADVLHTYGGHAMAAGLSLPADKLIEFRRRFSRAVRDQLGERPLEPELPIDAVVTLGDLTLDFVHDVARLEPFGNGNPPLTLAAHNLTVRSAKPLGRTGDHMQLVVEDSSGKSQRVLWWNGVGSTPPTGTIDLAFTVRESTYGGKREVAVEWVDARPSADAPLEIGSGAAVEVIDRRGAADPAAVVASLRREYPDAVVWREGGLEAESVGRFLLRPAETLLVYTPPPGPDEWDAVLTAVNPRRLLLVGELPEWDTPESFLKYLAGMVKSALTRMGGRFPVESAAVMAAARESSIRAGLEWLAADGQVAISGQAGDRLLLTAPGVADAKAKERAFARLRALLEETRAYRAYWLKRSRWP